MVVENPDNYSLDSQISGVLVTDCDSLALFAFFFFYLTGTFCWDTT